MEDYGVAKGYLELDVSDLESNVKSASRYLEQLERKSALAESELNKLESQSSRMGGVFQQNAQRTKELSVRMDQAKQKCKLYDQEIKSLNTICENAQAKQSKLASVIEKMSARYERAEQKVKQMAEAHGKESDEYQKAVSSARRVQNSLTQLKNKYDALGMEIEESGNRTLEFKTKLNNAQADVNRMSVELARAQSKAALYGQAMQGAGDKLQSAGAAIGSAGNTLTMGLTTPIVAAGTAAVKMASDAETSFAKVSTIADETVLTYDKMRSEVTEASDTTGVAITEFNEALYSSLSAGVESGKAIGFTTDMVKLAKGGFTDTAKAVDVVTSVLNAYGYSADEAGSISDKLITIQNIGKTTVDELAGSLGRVIPTAKAFNVGIDDVSTAMAIMTKRGIQTSEATTYYNSMLNELGSNGTKADMALRDLSGKGFSELIAQGTPLTEILQMLSDKAAQDGKSLADMFGSMEAGKAALSIMSDNGAEYNQVLDQMKNSAGATQEAFDKMNATPAAQMQIELNKLKNAGIEAGTQLLPHITNLVDLVGDLAEKFSDLSPEEQKAILKTAAFAAGMGPVLKVTSSAMTTVGGLGKGFGKMLKTVGEVRALKAAQKGISGVGEAAEVTSGSAGMMAKVISGMTSPIGLAVTAAAALGVGIVAVGTALEDEIGQTYRLTESQRENLTAMQETTATMQEQRSAREENVGNIAREYNGYRGLVTELQSITDANGQVKAGYEDRAKVITGLLSDALGIEISMQDGVIQNYDEVIAKSKELITQKEAEALITSMQDDMATAYQDTEKAMSEYAKAQKAVEEQQKKVTEAEEAYRKGGPAQYKAYQDAKAELDELEKSMDKAKTAMEDLSTEVTNYDALMEAVASGDTAQIESAMTRLVTSYQSFSEEMLKESEEARQAVYDQANSYVENMKLVQDGTVEVADSIYQEMATSAANAINEFSKLPGGIVEGLQTLGPEASGAIISSMAQANIDGVLSEEAKASVKSYLDGFDGLEEDTQEEWAQAWYGALKGLEGYEDLADPAEQGVDAFLESLRSKLEVHSPSKAVERIFSQVWPGASSGLDQGKEDLSGKGTGVVSGLLSSITDAVVLGIPGVAQAMGLLGSEGRGSMQSGLIGNGNLNPPGVFGIAGITQPLGLAGNLAMGVGLLSKVLSPPGVGEISNVSGRIGAAGNLAMGLGLRVAALSPPNINDLDGESKARKARGDMQGYFDNNPLSVVVNVVKKVGEALGFANGGIATTPSIFGEAGPEMAIPLSPGKRDRAKALYEQTGRILGITKTESEIRSAALEGASLLRQASDGRMLEKDVAVTVPAIDYELLSEKIAEKIAAAMKKAPIQPVIQMEDGDVVLNGERVGRKLAPVISRIQAQNT